MSFWLMLQIYGTCVYVCMHAQIFCLAWHFLTLAKPWHIKMVHATHNVLICSCVRGTIGTYRTCAITSMHLWMFDILAVIFRNVQLSSVNVLQGVQSSVLLNWTRLAVKILNHLSFGDFAKYKLASSYKWLLKTLTLIS